jgi:hypothetical protein
VVHVIAPAGKTPDEVVVANVVECRVPLIAMARLPPSRHSLHRRLRISDLQTGDDSPLNSSPPGLSRNLPYTTVTSPEDPPLRPERHVRNSIATMRRRLVAALATTLRVAHAARLQSEIGADIDIYDAVRLANGQIVVHPSVGVSA